MSNTIQKKQALLTARYEGVNDSIKALMIIKQNNPQIQYAEAFQALYDLKNAIDDKIQALYGNKSK